MRISDWSSDVCSSDLAFNKHLVANQTLLQAVLPGMRQALWGRIVNVISTSVKEPIPGLGVSNTIRGAFASWATTLSRELAARSAERRAGKESVITCRSLCAQYPEKKTDQQQKERST